jgi:putative transcriptional regulator
MTDSLKGQLLVASAGLVDPNFARTVVLVTEHGEEGAIGLVLNRPSTSAVEDAVPVLEPLAGADAPVYVGGPVQPDAVVVLAELEDPEDAAAIVFGTIGFVGLQDDEEPERTDPLRTRVFAGYAGWGEGQLEEELAEDAWILEPARPDDVFADDPEELWRDVLRRKGGAYAVLALLPADPSVN